MELSRSGKVVPIHYIVIALTILAPVMGGTNELWAEALLIMGTGLLFFFAPADRSLGLVPNIAFIGLLGLALVAFLPAHWFPIPSWRSELARIGVELPATVTAQPWITLEAVLSFLFGLAWTYYIFSFDWSFEARRDAWIALACAIVALSGALTIAFVLKKRISFWPDVAEFGFFPNRNHTSNVLGLGGIVVYALALSGLDQGKRTWWIWLAVLSLICWALILNFSRAGIILLCGGAFVWHLYWLFTAPSGHRRRPVIAYAAIVLVLAVFIWDGGKTVMRFVHETPGAFSLTGRFGIYRDALDLSLKSPITGIGLKNFGAIFATNQHFSAAADVAIHPESDWIWSAVELGWLGPFLIGFLFFWWAINCFPFEPRTLHLMRVAGFIVGCGFALHAFFDVPGHRIGAIWPALLMAATALHPGIEFRCSKVVSAIFRLVGILFVAIGLWWFASISAANVWPTRATLSRSLEEIENADARQDYEAMLARASQAMKIAPLNWELYFKRGFAEAALYHPHAEAVRDFTAARYLLPNWPDLYFQESQVWLALGDADSAFDVWREMLRQFSADAPRWYRDMLNPIRDNPNLVARWRELGREDPRCEIVSLRNAGPTEMRLELDRLFEEDPQLHAFTMAQRKTIFEEWYAHGDRLALIQTLQEHPEWQEIAWRELARAQADFQDYRPAYGMFMRRVPEPTLPKIANESVAALQMDFRSRPNNQNAGLKLAIAEEKSGETDGAIRTLEILASDPKPSPGVYYLLGQAWASKGDWPKAWAAISKYESILPAANRR